ncbi:hypothetical protein [Amycolatopsis albispora]|uniref:DUF4352 domain-containing protein n=1 Tax=Amycolatopsis albispora TaxID=1804986 RepID=A0A344LGT0_9PSEU|nr:hypothetical protein [Amycolatopsis albispora]AXB47254.1 hypothetical protein A4R43_36395 [Amycolatopsis albispora]
MRSRRPLLFACVLLATAGCGAAAVDTNTAMTIPGTEPAAHQRLVPAETQVDFGREFRFPDGLTVLVSTPRTFQPSATAYPRCARAVAFEVNLLNDGKQPYRLSGFSASATVAGEPAKQVVDSAQGFTGIVDAAKDVEPGRNVRLTFAFAMPAEPVELRMSVRPGPESVTSALYTGQA